jgi:hypothetical protein
MKVYRWDSTGVILLSNSTFSAKLDNFDVNALISSLEGEQPCFYVSGADDDPIFLVNDLLANALYGGWGVPHGAIKAESYLTAALTGDSSTQIAVREEECNGNRLLEADVFLAIMDSYPTALRIQDAENFEIVRVDSGYSSGLTATVAGFGSGGAVLFDHPKGAIVQRAVCFPSSIGVNGVIGARTQEERPAAVSNLTVDCPSSYTIDVSWDTHDSWLSPDQRGRVKYFDIYVLKHGDGISEFGIPEGVGELMLPSAEDEQPTDTSGTQSVTGITDYYNQSTKALASITVAGDYYVFVYPKQESGKKYDSLLGAVSRATVAVTS